MTNQQIKDILWRDGYHAAARLIEDLEAQLAAKRQFYVDTPLGKLKVFAKHSLDDPENFPGVYVDLITDEFPEGDLVACVEYENYLRRMQACVYADRTDDSPTNVIEIETRGEHEHEPLDLYRP